MRPRRILSLVVVVVSWTAPSFAQIDPLLFLKNANSTAGVDQRPNVLILVDLANRMQRDAPTDPARPDVTSNYYDPYLYQRDESQDWQATLGVTAANTTERYRRLYHGLTLKAAGQADRFDASTISVIRDRDPGYSTFEAPTRLSVARAGLYQAIVENQTVARFGLVRMRQTNPSMATENNSGPVVDADHTQNVAGTTEVQGGEWSISRPLVGATSNGATAAPNPVAAVKADSARASSDVLSLLARDVRTSGALLPAGKDEANTLDAPIALLLDDAKTEAARLIAADAACRNTVAILVTGGAEGTTTAGANPATTATGFLNVASGRRVPIHVIAIAPPPGDIAPLRAIATNSGGQYFEITKAEIDAAVTAAWPGGPAGTLEVPEIVSAFNVAISNAFASAGDFNAGRSTTYQVTSPIVGTVNLDHARDITGAALAHTVVYDKAGHVIPQRSNVMVTTGLVVPGLTASLRGFRMYVPAADSNRPSGYTFASNATPAVERRLWVACVPGPGCAAAPDSSKRNLYTSLADGTIIALTTDNAATLAPLMHLSVGDATAVIAEVRSRPLGPIVDSTPAIMNAPSLDPPPDDDYPAFAAANQNRRAIVWVGTNYGILEGIDARLGVELWGFIPCNLLPKLRTIRDGQPVGTFDFFVDGSPKVSDVKIDDVWKTHLIIGEGPGGTFFQSFDVTMSDMAGSVAADSDSLDAMLAYFASPTRITLNWAFPRYSSFDPAHGTYGDLRATATALEKSVGETWSDPAVGQIVSASGPYSILIGSGFLSYSQQHQANRGDEVAGTTFYVISARDGTVFTSRNVGSDGVNETVDDCRATAHGCRQIKNALQSDPVATGPSDSRFITKAYAGDLDGNLWRFDIGLDANRNPEIAGLTKLWEAGDDQPIFSSMATVNVGGTRQYVFFGTGSDLLPGTDGSTTHHLLGVLDNGTTGSQSFDQALVKTSTLGSDERVTSFPAVAGDIVFFTTTVFKPASPCAGPDATLYAFTFVGGAAYDQTGDNRVDSHDQPRVKTIAGQRATAPFIVDRHLVFSAGDKAEIFGDPQDYNNGVGQGGVRILSWREVR